MAIILHIDSSSRNASVSIAENGSIVKVAGNDSMQDHASFLHVAILSLLNDLSLRVKDLDAIAVAEGPGSYTGIRVGMATAKGLCYAATKPLITINTLAAMAKTLVTNDVSNNMLFCPLIDARRMEVFTAIYDREMNEILAPGARILNERSFEEVLKDNQLLFSGSGADKFRNLIQNDHAIFVEEMPVYTALNVLSFEKYRKQAFTDLVYSEPAYLKEFYAGL